MSSRLYIRYVPRLRFEPETIAYMTELGIAEDSTVFYAATAYEITGNELWDAVDLCVVEIKEALGLPLGVNNLSTKFLYIFLRVGGDATKHAVNLVDPSHSGTYHGGWTHDGSGALPNGSNAYFNTGYQGGVIGPGDNVNGENHCFFIELKTNSNALMMEIFCNDGARPYIYMHARTGGNMATIDGDQANTQKTDATANSVGLHAVLRESNASYKNIKDGTVLNTHADPSSNDFSTVDILEASFAGAAQFSDRKRTVSGEGVMTEAEYFLVRLAIINFETTLNR